MKLGNDGAREGEFASLDPLAGQEHVGDRSQCFRRSLDDDDFHDVIVFEQHLQGADDLGDVLALQEGQPGEQVVFLLVVEKSDRTGHHVRFSILGVLDQVFGDDGGERLRATLEAPLENQTIKARTDIRWERDTDTGDSRLCF